VCAAFPSIRIATVVAAMLVLAGCESWLGGKVNKPLEGERIEVLRGGGAISVDERIKGLKVVLPRPEVNAEWPQAGGYPNHAMHHLAASGPLARRWSADIGDGSSNEAQLLAQPVIADGKVYTIDIKAEISAFDQNTGNRLWRVELLKGDDDEGILGGGVAVNEGRLFATTGFADVVALDAKTGREIWRKRLSGPMRAAPTVWAGRVFAVTVANELYALSAVDGRELWTHSGLREVAGLVGGAAPAVDGGVVVVPYSSGEVVALRVENGRQVWTESLTPIRSSDAVSAIAHIRGTPVIDRGIVYVVGNSNRTVAVDLRTGNRLWEVAVGGINGAWVAGDFVYVVTRDAEVICLTRRGGRIRWVAQLPQYKDPEDLTGPIIWAGPVLAGDRLLVGNNEDEIWSLSPYSGKILGLIDIGGPVLIPPAVAGETVFVLTDDADLIALR
jgi:outer membrane protein assembly factor BamB